MSNLGCFAKINNILEEKNVAVFQSTAKEYPTDPPFNPMREYPEYPFKGSGVDSTNYVYDAVRETLKLLKLDSDNIDTKQWNPIGSIISPGDHVVIKPALTNFVNYSGDSIYAIIPHGSVIRAVLDYVILARPEKVVICDGPIPNTSFKQVAELIGLPQICDFVQSNCDSKLYCYDLRDAYAPKDKSGRVIDIFETEPDPLGYSIIDLGKDSLLDEISDDWMLYRSVSSNRFERFIPPTVHNKKINKYSIANTILDADVIINIPKLKLHRKVGLSVTLKNVVGITNNKFDLPHFREGVDDMPCSQKHRLRKALVILKEKLYSHLGSIIRLSMFMGFPIRDGNWPGNDTCWRMVLDLYRIMLYADKNGVLSESPQRRHIAIVDGIIGGDGFGPLAPTQKEAGVVLAGINPVVVDRVAATIMGLNPSKIKMLNNHDKIKRYRLVTGREFRVVSEGQKIRVPKFRVPLAWREICK